MSAHCGADISSAQAARLALRYQDAGEIKDKQPNPFLVWQMVGGETGEWRGRTREEGEGMSHKGGFN